MPIIVANRRKQLKTLEREFPGCEIIDLTSKAPDPWVRFSPFYPHGNIPVPFSTAIVSQSVEGLWQGLKVFEAVDVDLSKFQVTNMKGLKRTVRKYGRVLGHRRGTEGTELLDYLTARQQIYLPAYRWVLDNCLSAEIELLRSKAPSGVVLLDYETNGDVMDLSRPLSHAQLVKQYVEASPAHS